MDLTAEAHEDALIIYVKEERLDAAVAMRFKDRMRDVTEPHGAPAPTTAPTGPRVVLDLSRVTFLDSSGLGALVAVMKLMAPERRVELSGLQPGVEKVLRLTRMDTVFPIHRDLSQAIAAGLRNAV